MHLDNSSQVTTSANASTLGKHDLPGIQTLISDSWQLFKAVGVKLLLFEISVGFAIAMVALVLTLLGVLVWTTTQPFNLFSTPNLVSIVGIILELILVVGAILTLIYLGGADIAGSILIPAKYPDQFPIKQLFNIGFKLAFPIVAALLLAGLITWGGILLFVIPGIVIYILLSFYTYEIILNHQGVLDSLRRSYLIVSQNFWPIVLRFIVLGAISWVISFPFSILNSFTSSIAVTILESLVRLAFALFSVCYGVVLYKQASQGLSGEKGKKIGWMVIVAVIGWILFVVIIILLVTVVGSNIGKAINGSGLENVSTQLQGQQTSYPLPSGYQHLQDTAITPGARNSL